MSHVNKPRDLMICRPCFIENAADFSSFQFLFWREEWGDADYIKFAIKDRTKIFVEQSLVPLVKKAAEPTNTAITFVPDFIDQSHDIKGGVAFLASNDTHVSFMLEIAKHFENVIFFIPSIKNKSEGAAELLNRHNQPFIEIPYDAQEDSFELPHNIHGVLTAADWTSEFLALRRVLKHRNIPIIALQEGPQDWHLRFRQNDKIVIPNHYRNADISIMQGATSFLAARPSQGTIIGNPKVNKFTPVQLPDTPSILINLNFSYIKTKPDYETHGQAWLKDILSVMASEKIDYRISQHPRDEVPCDDNNLIKSNASKIKDQLISSTIIITRFSSVIFEALALGRHVIYYNPHGEPMPYLQGLTSDCVKLATSPADLKSAIKDCLKQGEVNRDEALTYLRQHAGQMNGKALAQISDFITDCFQSVRRIQPVIFDTAADSSVAVTEMPRKTIAIYSEMPSLGISGGRYHALMKVHALAEMGHNVFFVTNAIPIFWDFFNNFNSNGNIQLILTETFEANMPAGVSFDLIIGVPGGSQSALLLNQATLMAHEHEAHIALLNFESGNWFNENKAHQKPLSFWNSWLDFAASADIIISSAKLASHKAKPFYGKRNKNLTYVDCGPSVNYEITDVIPKPKTSTKHILVFYRSSAAEHKGIGQFDKLITEAWRNSKLTVICGINAYLHQQLEQSLEKKTSAYNIDLTIVSAVSDKQKCDILNDIDVIVFPSFFEGFGLPPVEGIFFDKHVVCFDLPVLRETCGDAIIAVPIGDWEALSAEISEVLADKYASPSQRAPQDFAKVQADYCRSAYGRRLDAMLYDRVTWHKAKNETRHKIINLKITFQKIWPVSRQKIIFTLEILHLKKPTKMLRDVLLSRKKLF